MLAFTQKRKKVYWETGAFNSAKKKKKKRKVRVGNNGKANSSWENNEGNGMSKERYM